MKTADQAIDAAPKPQGLPAGVTLLSRDGARLKRNVALAAMLIPLLGFAEAVRLLATGRFGSVDLWLFGAMYFVQMAGITMGFHRMMAHRAFKTGKVFRALLLVSGSMAAEGPLLDWVATHRRHHAYSDRPGDPHSPHVCAAASTSSLRGLWHAHMPWMLAADMSSWSHFARDVLADKQLFFFHRTYFLWIALGLALPAAIGAWFGGWQGAWSGFIFGGLARIFVANQFAWCVGSVSHMWGTRPFRTRDRSANNWWVAFMTFGEGLQNNHHAFPSSYRHGVTWWEPDLSGWLLTLLGKLSIVWEMREPSAQDIEQMRVRGKA